MKIFDISSKISQENLFLNQKLPNINFKKSIKKGNKCTISEINNLESHIGTHIDFPFHMLENGKNSGDYDINKFHGEAIVIHITKFKNIISILKNQNLKDKILLIKSNSKYQKDYFYLSEEETIFLINKGIKNIGIDTFSIDGYGKTSFENHKLFFQSDILIYEGLNLENVEEGEYYFFGIPIKIDRLEAGLVRSFLIQGIIF